MLNKEVFSVDDMGESITEKPFSPFDKDGLFDLINHRVRYLGVLKTALEKEGGKRKPTGVQEKATKELAQRVKNHEMLQSSNEPFKKFSDFNQIAELKLSVQEKYGDNLTQRQLLMLAESEAERQICYQLIRFFESEVGIIQDTYTELLEGHISAAKRRLKGRQKNAKKNQEVLKLCLQKAKRLIEGKRWKDSDYIIFRNLAHQDEFKPVFIPEPRVAGERKGLAQEERDKHRKDCKRSTWAESALRKFFEEQTGTKPTTKKKDL